MSETRKSIFIAGAAAGIGRATAMLFGEKGSYGGVVDAKEQELTRADRAKGEFPERVREKHMTGDPFGCLGQEGLVDPQERHQMRLEGCTHLGRWRRI
ncbi:MAG: hypothetical protein V3S89_07160 [Desulfobacterales bacterium]